MTRLPLSVARPRLGFLGVGWIGLHRMRALQESGVAEVAAVADPAPEAARAAAAVAGGCPVAGSLDALLAMGVEGVVIATPSALHAEQAVQALEGGAAVFCQKPLGRDAAEARRVVDAARRAGRLLGVDLSYRHVRGMEEVRRLVAEGALGQRLRGRRSPSTTPTAPTSPGSSTPASRAAAASSTSASTSSTWRCGRWAGRARRCWRPRCGRRER